MGFKESGLNTTLESLTPFLQQISHNAHKAGVIIIPICR